MNPLLKVENLTVSFKQKEKKVTAVRGVSFSLYPKETIGIVGESGSGKSVMAKTLLKLIRAPSIRIEKGSVFYKEKDLIKLSERQMQKVRGKEIAMIFQDPMTSLNPTMRIGEQILEGIYTHDPSLSHKAAYQKVLDLLSLVKIPEPILRFSQYPHELSGGMRQRVMIAIALAPSPKILIADEPTTALDVTIQAQILSLLKEIQEKTETSILFITHNLGVVANFCHRVFVMYAGKIVEEADVDTLFEEPKHPYTKKLLLSIPRLDLEKGSATLIPIKGAPPSLSQKICGCSFFPRCESRLNICKEKEPPLFTVESKCKAACFLYADKEKNYD